MKKIFSFCVSLYILFFLFPGDVLASDILFEDDFETGQITDWEIKSGDWRIEEIMGSKMFGAKVGGHNTIIEAQAGNFAWQDYIYELDMVAIAGADKNFIFRVSGGGNRYGVHLVSSVSNEDRICMEKWIDGQGWDFCKNSSFVNNKIYHLKIIVINSKIQFYIDNNLIINFDDITEPIKNESEPILNGRIGLIVSTGVIFPSEVYFDNIKVTKINRPVVIIPGHGASISFKEIFLGQENADDWQMLPGVHVYDNLINSLIANGYEKDKDLFVFYYNWLDSVPETAGKLYQFIEDILVSSDNIKVDIIGHSMGGLVARTCIQENTDNCFVDHFITVGSPHRGVLETYGAWEGGQVWRQGFSKLAFELFLNIKKEFGETKRQALQRLAPSTQNMLPNFSYLKNENGKEIAFGETNYPQSNLFSQIGGVEELAGKTAFIYGSNKETLRWLRVDENLNWFDEALGNWPHGKPIEKEISLTGDGTVLEMSAYPEASMSGTAFDLGHREIISDEIAINKINEILEIKGQAVVEDWQKAENFLVFYIHSPAYLEMEGLTTETVFEGKENNKTKLFIIANPLPEKIYRINVVGDGEGQYSLLIGKMINNNLTWETYQGKAVSEQTNVFDVKFASSLTFIGETDEGQIKLLLHQSIIDLKENLTETALLDKIAQLENLIEIDYELSLEYAYQIRNFASLLAKETVVNFDLTATIAKIDKIILYLKVLAVRDHRSVASIEASANYQDSAVMLNFLKPLPYFSLKTKSFLSLAANDFLTEENHFLEAEKLINEEQFFSGWLLSRSSYYLGKNNKILLN